MCLKISLQGLGSQKWQGTQPTRVEAASEPQSSARPAASGDCKDTNKTEPRLSLLLGSWEGKFSWGEGEAQDRAGDPGFQCQQRMCADTQDKQALPAHQCGYAASSCSLQNPSQVKGTEHRCPGFSSAFSACLGTSRLSDFSKYTQD